MAVTHNNDINALAIMTHALTIATHTRNHKHQHRASYIPIATEMRINSASVTVRSFALSRN